MPASGEDLARDTDGQAPGRGVGAHATGEPMPYDRPSSNGKHGLSQSFPESEEEKFPTSRRPFYTHLLLMAVLATLLLGGAIAGMRYWQYARQYESTDDAFIQGHIIQISPKVSAQVTRP
jgi:membrane fusion protein, multidrug efflux system